MSKNSKDIIIIGAGLGGLITGALLSKEGFKVEVLEKNKQIGGCLQGFALDGKLFESAVHYVGSLSPNQTLYKIFKYLGIIDQLDLQALDAGCFDKIVIQDEEFELAQGHENFIESLSIKFPTQYQIIRNYVDGINHVCKRFPLYNIQHGSEGEKQKVLSQALQEMFIQFGADDKLQQVLTGNNMLYAGSLEQNPFYIHALIQNSYIEGSYKFKNGSAQLANLLRNVIQQQGGKVKRNTEIKKLVEIDGKIQHAIDQHGERHEASHFISNLHPQVTYAILDSKLIRPIARKRIATLPNTISSFLLNISLKPGIVPYRNHNIYYHLHNNTWHDITSKATLQPGSFGIFFTEDKTLAGFATSISVLTYMDASATALWDNSFHTTGLNTRLDREYLEFKETQSAYILSKIKDIIPEIQNAISQTDACTPLSYRDYLHSPGGSMYGIQKEIQTLSQSSFATRTKIPNLYLTGQNINLHGVLGVCITGILNTSDFCGLEYMVNKINSAQ
ncbi:MAG: NAD(P)/FAD-dependent oxidoreductase [Bacteroidetes bacterium]|nr:NAD(P)/FAD-dependent oxidoreductase [Bacteroidota bacterium]